MDSYSIAQRERGTPGSRLWTLSGGVLAHTAVALALGACASERDDPRPNVLLVSFDSTRRELVSAYGEQEEFAGARAVTPNLDRLAREGALFEDAVATTSWTLASHAAILTGTPDLVHAVELPDYGIPHELPTLAEHLQRAGFRTAGFFSGPYLEPEFGFGRGFETYSACYGAELARAADAARESSLRAAEHVGAEVDLERLAVWQEDIDTQRALEVAAQRDRSSAAVVDAALRELEAAAREGRPFFFFAHFFDPHYDYVPPEPFDRSFDPDYAGAIDGRDFYRNPAVSEPDPGSPGGRRRTASDRDLRHLRGLYAGDTAATDRELGRLLVRLDDLDLTRNTLVVVLSDHGDEFFEHGGIGHRRTLFEEAVRVPLLMRLPDVIRAGTRVARPVSTADVAPTVLELLGVHEEGSAVPSLVPLLLPSHSGRPAPPGPMSRLVRTEASQMRIQDGTEVLTVPVDRIHVTESYRKDSIKVTCDRSWIRPPANLRPDVLELLREESSRQRDQADLRWIDLERHPDEAEQDHSTDFGEPRAREALEEFRRRHQELLRERRQAARRHASVTVESALGGLGYTEVEANAELVPSSELATPAPRLPG